MALFDFLFQWINIYPAIVVFLTTFLLGDETVYFLSFISGHGMINLFTVILFSILGNGGCDLFWFSVARSKSLAKIKGFFVKKLKKDKEDLDLVKESFSKRKLFFTLLFSKFFYGTRLITIFYNTLAVILWVFVIANILWYIGRVTSVSFDIIKNANRFVGFFILFIIILHLLNIFVFKKIFLYFRTKPKK